MKRRSSSVAHVSAGGPRTDSWSANAPYRRRPLDRHATRGRSRPLVAALAIGRIRSRSSESDVGPKRRLRFAFSRHPQGTSERRACSNPDSASVDQAVSHFRESASTTRSETTLAQATRSDEQVTNQAPTEQDHGIPDASDADYVPVTFDHCDHLPWGGRPHPPGHQPMESPGRACRWRRR